MAGVFGCSFNHFVAADIGTKWAAESAAGSDYPLVTDPALPTHGRCLQMTNKWLQKVLATPLQTFVVGFWFRASAAAAGVIIQGMDSATPTSEHISLRRDATNHLTFTRNATVLATSTLTLSTNTWYHIEFKATIGDAADSPSGNYEVRVDGTSVNWIPDAGSGKDTRNGGNQNVGAIRIAGGAFYISDFYILNTTGAVSSDFVGPSRFRVAHPVGVGTTAEWAGNYADNWENVADELADGDVTFNQSSTPGQTDQFAMTDVPAGTIHFIQHVIQVKRDVGAARTIRPLTRIGGTDYAGTTVSVPTSYAFLTEAVTLSPATGAAWDDAEINATEFGYELVS